MKLYGKIMVPMMLLFFLGIAVVAFSGYAIMFRALTEVVGAQSLNTVDIAALGRRIGLVVATVSFGVLSVAGVALLLLLRSVVNPVKGVAKILLRRSELDFTLDNADRWMIDRSKARDEIAQMIRALTKLRVNLEEMVRAIRFRSEYFSKSAESLASLSGETVASMQEVKSSIEMVFSLLKETVQGIRQTADGLGEVAASAFTAATVASEGEVVAAESSRTSGQALGKVEQMISKVRTAGVRTEESARSMGGIAASVNSIGDFVATIKSIADQTNLLALNAAIEAARAGVAGRGFSVVADEVRKLAEESNLAAKEVESLITSLQEETKRALDVTNEAGGVMRETVGEAEETQRELKEAFERIERMNSLMHNLAETASKQESVARAMMIDIERANSGTVSLTETFSGIRSAAEDTAGASESVAREASDLAEGAHELQTTMRGFRIEDKASSAVSLQLLK